MGQIKDLTGKTFYRWTVVNLSHQNGKMLYWNCICECGTKRAVFGGDLKRGGSKSCGCLMREERAVRSFKHGLCDHPGYSTWRQMRQRCSNPKNGMYPLYGGRGITVCKEWESFEAFWNDMGPTWKRDLSIDRIDVNGNYERSNCQWATPKQQADNRRDKRLIPTPTGPMKIDKAARLYGISQKTLAARHRYGWTDPEKMVSPPRPTTRDYHAHKK